MQNEAKGQQMKIPTQRGEHSCRIKQRDYNNFKIFCSSLFQTNPDKP